MKPHFSESAFLGVIWTAAGVPLIFLVARLGIRIRLAGNLAADDVLVLAAWVMLLAKTSLWAALYKEMFFSVNLSDQLANGILPPINDATLRTLGTFLQAQLAAQILGYTGLWTIKLAFMFFFRNLGSRIRSQNVIWWMTMVFVILSWGAIVGLLEYDCFLSSGLDIIKHCTNHWYPLLALRVTTVLDITTDAAILGVSTNILWRAKIDLMKKLGLAGIFSLTGFIMVASIIRAVMGVTSKEVYALWTIAWNSVEIGVAIIVACLVSFRKLYIMSRASGRQQRPVPVFGHSIGGGGFGQRLLRPKRTHLGSSTLSTNTGLGSDDTQTTLAGIHVQHDIQTRSSPTTTLTESASRSTYVTSFSGPSRS